MSAERTWTVLGIWIEDEPISVGVVEGDHLVYGGEAANAEQGPWAETVEAETAEDAESLAVDRMIATLETA